MQSSGEDGVILFTLGTYFSAVAKLTPGFVEMFANTFRKLPQKVIWQLVDPPSDLELSPNIKIFPWVPQNDLLGKYDGVSKVSGQFNKKRNVIFDPCFIMFYTNLFSSINIKRNVPI